MAAHRGELNFDSTSHELVRPQRRFAIVGIDSRIEVDCFTIPKSAKLPQLAHRLRQQNVPCIEELDRPVGIRLGENQNAGPAGMADPLQEGPHRDILDFS